MTFFNQLIARTSSPPKGETRNDRHARFINALGDRIVWKYTDGGAGVTRDKRKSKAAKHARKGNRR